MSDKEQQTEQATPRRREKLREEGKIARSGDIGAVAAIAAVTATLAATGASATESVIAFSSRAFRLVDAERPISAMGATLPILTSALLPCLVAAAVATIAVGLAQTRGLFMLSLAAPKLERLDPAPQLARMLPNKETFVELAKSLLKIAALGFVIYRIIAAAMPRFALLPAVSATVAAAEVGHVAVRVALYGGLAFAVVAAFDYFLAHRRFQEEAKMSRKDVRDEHKEEEGDPLVRRRARARMREVNKRRAIADVKTATVLVANPTHVSVALRYEPSKDAAPTVLAKGIDEVAMQMRSEARKHGVPIVENRPVARALYKHAKVGKPIPVELYKVVAEVIAHVMRLRGTVLS